MEAFVGCPNAFVAFTLGLCNVGPVALAIAFVVLVGVALNREFRVVVMMVVVMVSVLLCYVAFREVAEGLS